MDQHLPAEVYAIPALWEICIVGVDGNKYEYHCTSKFASYTFVHWKEWMEVWDNTSSDSPGTTDTLSAK
jgi:hypothetical protein